MSEISVFVFLLLLLILVYGYWGVVSDADVDDVLWSTNHSNVFSPQNFNVIEKYLLFLKFWRL